MKARKIFFGVLAFLALLAIGSIPYLTDSGVKRVPLKDSVSPEAENRTAMIAQIGKAKDEILVEARSFTSVALAKALVDAARRGVSIAVILDRDQQESRQYAFARYLANSKITTYVDVQRAISSDSFMIIDGETVVTGSFDATPGSSKPRVQNLLVAQSGEVAKTYVGSWNDHKANSAVYNVQ